MESDSDSEKNDVAERSNDQERDHGHRRHQHHHHHGDHHHHRKRKQENGHRRGHKVRASNASDEEKQKSKIPADLISDDELIAEAERVDAQEHHVPDDHAAASDALREAAAELGRGAEHDAG